MSWTRGRMIGHGSTATVSIATGHVSDQVVAVKSAELSQAESLKRESRILASLSCPQIVAYRGCDVTCENGKLLYNVFMEYVPGGTIADTLRRRGSGLDEATVRSYTRQILAGLEYLHGNGIVHCDIKAHNVLVAKDGVKIADLGCARRVDGAAPHPVAGTPLFMAPEVARGEDQGFSADIWALGCTVIEIVTSRAPWTNIGDPASTLYLIGFSDDLPEIPIFMSKQGKDFLSKCLKRDPQERWTATELLGHAFLEEPTCLSEETDFFESESPTTVLDQGFWYSTEELETAPSPSRRSFSDTPARRIQRLAEDQRSSSTEAFWDCDENWVTVRISSVKETEVLDGSLLDSSNAGEPTSSNRWGTIEFSQDTIIQLRTESNTASGTPSFSSSSTTTREGSQESSILNSLTTTTRCTEAAACQRLSSENDKRLSSICFLLYSSSCSFSLITFVRACKSRSSPSCIRSLMKSTVGDVESCSGTDRKSHQNLRSYSLYGASLGEDLRPNFRKHDGIC